MVAIAGWFITFLLISQTAKRSYHYERAKSPQGKLFSRLGAHSSMLRYLVGVYTFWTFMLAGTLITLVMLIVKIVEMIFGDF